MVMEYLLLLLVEVNHLFCFNRLAQGENNIFSIFKVASSPFVHVTDEKAKNIEKTTIKK